MKNKKLLTGILLAVLLVVIVGISYALYSYDETGSTNNIQSGKITFSFVEPSNSYVVENALPTTDEESERSDDYFEFKIISHATTNANDNVGVTIPYTVVLEKMTIDSGKKQLNENQVKVNLTTVASGVETDVVEPTLISNLEGYKTHSKVLYDTSVTHKNGSSELTTTYRLRAWIDYSVDASNWSTTGEYQYKFRININSEGEVEEVSKVVGSTNDWTMNAEPNSTGGYTITGFIGDIENSDNVEVVENYFTDDNLSPMFFGIMGIESADDMPSKNAYNVTIPNVLIDEGGNEYEITELGPTIFVPMNFETGNMIEEYMRITKMIISEGIIEINDGADEMGAFVYDFSLVNVVFPSTLKKMGDYAFMLNSFDSIALPEGLEEIGDYAFSSDNALKKIYKELERKILLPEENCPDMVLHVCPASQDVEDEWIELVGAEAKREFLEIEDSNIGTLVIPSSVMFIGESAFSGFGLLEVIFEGASNGTSSLTSIGYHAFANNFFSHEKIYLPSSLTTAEEGIFYHPDGYCYESMCGVGDYNIDGLYLYNNIVPEGFDEKWNIYHNEDHGYPKTPIYLRIDNSWVLQGE